MDMQQDIIVIGAGHAGCEAALAAARMGLKVSLLTMNNDHIAYMSCNPAIGGQAKGQLAREVDALGGEMGLNTDRSALQYKRLNMSRGPAVRSSRAQCDKALYSLNMKQVVETQENLRVAQREVLDIKIENGRVCGVVTNYGEFMRARAVIITAGTFLRGIMHCGERRSSGGRAGDSASNNLSAFFENIGLKLVRLKTGTPPRLQRSTINFDILTREDGDTHPVPFSFYFRPQPFPFLEQLPCYLTYTNKSTHEIIVSARERSPMFTGQITGRGPRYCPSIEDKVFRFWEKERHQIFLEPESRYSREIYANGLSTSLPVDIQLQFLRTIPGLEHVDIARPGYAVEYDAINPTILRHSLELKDIPGLFFAGQVNGTSGYEEAAGQGIIAGINAARRCREEEPIVLGRETSYIAVMIDDLVTKGCDEPYRMFTSRAEFRLLLREDTADFRLGEIARSIGLLSEKKYRILDKKRNDLSKLRNQAKTTYFYPANINHAKLLENFVSTPIKDRVSAMELLRRPEISIGSLIQSTLFAVNPDDYESEPWIISALLDELETSIKYEGYIRRENETVNKIFKHEKRKIPIDFPYNSIQGLSNEVREKLERIRPETLGQAQRISGITPAAVALLYVHLARATNFLNNTDA